MHSITRTLRSAGPIAFCAAVACGARTDFYDGTRSGGIASFAPHPACATADGVRLCGGDTGCPEIAAPTCAGFGCTHAFDVNQLTLAAGGVCWSDLPDDGRDSCATCADGQVCVERGPDSLVCVSPHVCEALWDIGVRDVCRYADKSRYDHRSIPDVSSACPVDSNSYRVCGGACATCKPRTRCVGRSPDHPFGICTTDVVETTAEFAPCSIVNGAVTSWCQSPGGAQSDWACAAFSAPQADRAAALRYGLCMLRHECLTVASALPGGLECYDVAGKRIQ